MNSPNEDVAYALTASGAARTALNSYFMACGNQHNESVAYAPTASGACAKAQQ